MQAREQSIYSIFSQYPTTKALQIINLIAAGYIAVDLIRNPDASTLFKLEHYLDFASHVLQGFINENSSDPVILASDALNITRVGTIGLFGYLGSSTSIYEKVGDALLHFGNLLSDSLLPSQSDDVKYGASSFRH